MRGPIGAAMQSLYSYTPALVAPWYTPSNRFVILTVGRTGSELLRQLLDSHPDIVCDGEILAGSPSFPRLQTMASGARARLGGAEVYGWKLLVGQLRDVKGIHHPERYITRLSEAGVRVILLERKDHLQQAISWHCAHSTEFHHHRGRDATFVPQEIDPEMLLWATASNEEATEWLRRAVAPVPHLSIAYEDGLLDAADQQSTLDRVCRFLGVGVAPMSCDLVKISPRRSCDRVSNWDEVESTFRGSRFACFVADSPVTSVALAPDGC